MAIDCSIIISHWHLFSAYDSNLHTLRRRKQLIVGLFHQVWNLFFSFYSLIKCDVYNKTWYGQEKKIDLKFQPFVWMRFRCWELSLERLRTSILIYTHFVEKVYQCLKENMIILHVINMISYILYIWKVLFTYIYILECLWHEHYDFVSVCVKCYFFIRFYFRWNVCLEVLAQVYSRQITILNSLKRIPLRFSNNPKT